MTEYEHRLQAFKAAVFALWNRREISSDMAICALEAAKVEDAAQIVFRWWKIANKADPNEQVQKPCRFETFSGECLHCGARLEHDCEWERS